MSQVIQSLWIGAALSTMERLTIVSFLAQGHAFDLYCYGSLANVPDGVRLRDGADILPPERMFRYRDHPSYSGFANYFRYKLLLERGGWWVDMDAVCLKPFDFDDVHVFSSERTRDGRQVPNAGFIKAPAGSPVMDFLWRECTRKEPTAIAWGETGPRLVERAIGEFGLEGSVQESDVFCPVSFFDWHGLLEDRNTDTFPAATRAVHLWNEMWRRAGQDKDAAYPPRCPYERLKASYGGLPLLNP
jgi:hypothetical protein